MSHCFLSCPSDALANERQSGSCGQRPKFRPPVACGARSRRGRLSSEPCTGTAISPAPDRERGGSRFRSGLQACRWQERKSRPASTRPLVVSTSGSVPKSASDASFAAARVALAGACFRAADRRSSHAAGRLVERQTSSLPQPLDQESVRGPRTLLLHRICSTEGCKQAALGDRRYRRQSSCRSVAQHAEIPGCEGCFESR